MTNEQLDQLAEAEHRFEMAAVADARAKVMKLNEAEILVLAKHFKLYVPSERDIRLDGWAGWKEELSYELAPLLVDQI